jgi:hypothetical protein
LCPPLSFYGDFRGTNLREQAIQFGYIIARAALLTERENGPLLRARQRDEKGREAFRITGSVRSPRLVVGSHTGFIRNSLPGPPGSSVKGPTDPFIQMVARLCLRRSGGAQGLAAACRNLHRAVRRH